MWGGVLTPDIQRPAGSIRDVPETGDRTTMKTDELRKLIEQQGYSVEESELDDDERVNKFWRVRVTKAGRLWIANGIIGQPVTNAYRNLGSFLDEILVVDAGGHRLTTDDIEYIRPDNI